MKYKVKKQMTLPELIQWGWDNGIENEEFYGSSRGCVRFSDYGWIGIDEWVLVKPDDNFEVDIEEEITEETEIPILVEVYKTLGGYLSSAAYNNKSINYILDAHERYQRQPAKAFYMLNDDMTMTLIWKNGEMVE